MGFRFLYVIFVAIVLICRGVSKYDLRKTHMENFVEGWSDTVFNLIFIYWLVTIVWMFALDPDIEGSGFWHLFLCYWFGSGLIQFLLGLIVALPFLGLICFFLGTIIYVIVADPEMPE